MLLDEIVRAQLHGEARGIPSICSAHAWVLREALRVSESSPYRLIEPTCNQVNQFGGYTGMTPADFAAFARGLAQANQFPVGNVLLGGDHLGPSVWQQEAAETAMQKAAEMVRAYVRAGFVKLHLDCSMRLGDDPPGGLDPEIAARRMAQLAQAAETASEDTSALPRYVVGTEVPVPGGAQEPEAGVHVTKVEDTAETIELARAAFRGAGLESAWERVVALVVQPGVEFGDDFVIPYQPEKARDLSRFIEGQHLVYEAHSTDYQTRTALTDLVQDHFAILKVGPALTFAFREAIYALAMMEDELLPRAARSDVVHVLDEVMMRRTEYWRRYYRGSDEEQAAKRKFSFSDRIRYYWPDPQVQAALQTLLNNLNQKLLPLSLLSQFAPRQYNRIRRGELERTPEAIISDRLGEVLLDYDAACLPEQHRPFATKQPISK